MHISISKVNFKSIGINIAKVDFGRYDSGGEPQLNGLYITPADASAISVTPNDSYYTLHGKYLKYSLNGKKWKDWNGSVTIKPEQKMYLKGEDDYVCNSSTSGKLITSDGYYNVGGDISSLTNFITEVKDYTFYKLFYNDSYIKDASSLLLPATILTANCYFSMFSGCTSLTAAPVLPATTLADRCYVYMFSGCTSLTAAPVLPATTLATYCYDNMFRDCISLTTVPELPATTLKDYCYQFMFQGCTSLNNITMLATDISAFNCLSNWVNGVASTGTFTKAASMTSLPTGVNGIPEGWTVKDYTDYMTLTALGNGMITITIPAAINSSYATSLSYSKDKSTWNETIIDDTAQTISIPVTSGENVYLKGIAKQLCKDYKSFININSTAGINASGNIMSLLYGDDYKDKVAFPSGSTYTFAYLFNGNTHLISAENLILHATTLAKSCYSNMFQGCKSLTTAPELPATTLTTYCYYSMFRDCISLTTAPELPATTLASNCYSYMFYKCTSLVNAPELHATTLAQFCYRDMFVECTSLTTAPELPATTLADYCYYEMFMYCNSLKTAPELHATTLKSYCYHAMFKGCTSLTAAPTLPATTLAGGCYSNMFESCNSLKTAPELPATTLYGYCYSYMFYNCTELETAPELPAAILKDYCYQFMFQSCKKINSITMLATDKSATNPLYEWVVGVSSTGTFTKSPEMTSLPTGVNGIPSGWTVVDYTDYMTLTALGNGMITITIPAAINSSYATSLSYSKDKSTWNETIIDDTAQTISIPVTSGENVYLKGIAKQLCKDYKSFININSTAGINASGNIMSLLYGDDYKDKVAFPSGSTYTFAYLFNGNTHLISAENLILPATTLATNCYDSMFYGCTSLTTAPELPATTLARVCYSYMFSGCTSLTTAPTLPATTLADNCYESMFNGCTSLTAAPELPATTLTPYCYYGMFNVCTSLTTAPSLPATTLTDYCYYEMFMYCNSLKTAPELHATTLKSYCYHAMFKGCTSLTAAPTLPATTLAGGCYSNMFESCNSLKTAPELPATTLYGYCYSYMFYNCTELETAPELPAAILKDYCYQFMFQSCKKINSITMLATDKSATNPLYEWVVGVSSTGTFTKSPEMTSLPTGVNGIPSGWTVVDYGAA